MTSFYDPKDDYDDDQYQFSAISCKKTIFYTIKIDLWVRNPGQAPKPLKYSDGARQDASSAPFVISGPNHKNYLSEPMWQTYRDMFYDPSNHSGFQDVIQNRIYFWTSMAEVGCPRDLTRG